MLAVTRGRGRTGQWRCALSEQSQRPGGGEHARQPDQAEGEREGVKQHPAPKEIGPTPGQAEGDRETVDAALREQEQKGS